MRYDEPSTREMLAAEYALGKLKGAALRRYESLLHSRKDWQQSADWWAAHLHLLADTVPAATPPKRLWQLIESRLFGLPPPALLWWRRLALAASGVAVALALMVAGNLLQPVNDTASASSRLAVLSDPQAKSAWLLKFASAENGSTEIRATALAGATRHADKSFELWLLPADKSSPVSLGLLPQAGQANAKVAVPYTQVLAGNGLAVTLEPKGGSPSGQATGPIMYQGQLTQL